MNPKLTIQIQLIRIVADGTVIQMVFDAIVVHVNVAQVASAIAIRIQLIGVRHFRAIVLTVLDTISIAIDVTVAGVTN